MTTDLASLFADVPLDIVLCEIIPDYVPGSSGPGGWSARGERMACKYKGYLNERIEKIKFETAKVGRRDHFLKTVQAEGLPEPKNSEALEIGILYHLLQGNYYSLMLPEGSPNGSHLFNPETLRRQLLDRNINGDIVREAYRLHDGYQAMYENDLFEPLAVERRVEVAGISCRLDLIVKVSNGHFQASPGIWIVEHKTAAREDFATMEGWQNDGQILQQIWCYNMGGLVEEFGPLQGIIVNVAIKTKVPKYPRKFIPPDMRKAEDHVKDLRFDEGLYAMCRAAEFFPRNRKHCTGRYVCEFFQHCAVS